MRKISLLHLIFGRHGPRNWLSWGLSILLCLVNVLSIAGIGFSLPTSQAATHLIHPTQQSHEVLTHRVQKRNIAHHPKTQKVDQIQHNNLKPHRRLIGPDLSITNIVSSASVHVGDTVTYILSTSNGATADPTMIGQPITVTDLIPLGMTNVTATAPPGWSIVIDTNTSPSVITAIYTGTPVVTAGMSLPNITITGVAAVTGIGILPNTATAVATGDLNPSNNVSIANVTISPLIPPANLGLAITNNSNSSCIKIGNNASYTLTVTNDVTAGTYTSGAITVGGILPVALDTPTFSGADWNVTFPVPGTFLATYIGSALPIAPGSSLQPLTFRGAISSLVGTSLIANATLADNPLDIVTNNKIGTDTINICPRPDLRLAQIHVGSGPFQVGQPITYLLSASNNANVGSVEQGQSITVVDTIPIGLNNITATAPSGWTFNTFVTTSPTVITATYAGPYPVNAGQPLPDITITGMLTVDALGTFVNPAIVNTPLDLALVGNSVSDSISVVAQPHLAVALTHVGSGCNPTTTINDTLTITNTAGPVLVGPIIATFTAPVTMSNISVADGTDWTITSNGLIYTLTYSGSYPVAAGSLSPVTITGNVTEGTAVALEATVTTPTDLNITNHEATDAITICSPDLTVTQIHVGTGPFQIGQPFAYTITIGNSANAGPIQNNTTPITFTDQLPLGLTNLQINANGWSTITSNGVITGTYTGGYPVAGNTSLPSINITGNLINSAAPSLSNIVTAITPNDSNASNNVSNDTVTVDLLPDLTAVLAHTNSGCVVNGAITYTLNITNSSQAGPIYSDQPITASVLLPTDLNNITFSSAKGWQMSLNGTTLTAAYNGNYPIASNTDLPTITLVGQLTSPSSPMLAASALVTLVNDSNPVDNTSTDTLQVCGPDVVISQTQQRSGPFQIGQNVSLVISVSNDPTAGPVFNGNLITVTDQLPLGLNNMTVTGTNWDVTLANGAYVLNYTGSYPVNAGAVLPDITVTGQLTSEAGSTFSNIATINTPTDVNSNNNTAIVTFPVVSLPDLSASLTTQNAGCNNTYAISYTLAISNAASTGPVISGPITVHITTPPSLNNLSISANVPADWTLAANIDQSWTMTYTGKYPVAEGSTLSSISITGNANASPVLLAATVSTATDINPTNNAVSNSIAICAPDLVLTLNHIGEGPFQVGQNITYTLAVANVPGSGPVLDAPITVTDQLPTGLENASASGNNWTTSIAPDNTLTATYTGTFPVNANTILPNITLTALLNSKAAPKISNTASISATNDSNAVHEQATDMINVRPLSNLTLTIARTESSCVNIDDQVDYSVLVTNSPNAGPILANTPVTIVLNFPADLSNIVIASGGAWQGLGPISTTTATLTFTTNIPIEPGDILPLITISSQLANPTSSSGILLTGNVSAGKNSGTNQESSTATLKICAPDLAITKMHLESSPFQIGDTVTFLLAVTNIGNGPVLSSEPILVTDPIPTGLSSITASGPDWYVTILNKTIIANYIGSYPIETGTSLTNIIVSGQINSQANQALTNIATVSTPRDQNLYNNTSSETLSIQAAPDLSLRINGPATCVRKNTKASFIFLIDNADNAGPIASNIPITLTFRIPIDLEQMSFSGNHWQWKKNGSLITAIYTHSQTITLGDQLDSFIMTGKVLKSARSPITVGARVYVNNDGNRSNDTSDSRFSLCKINNFGNLAASISANHSGRNATSNSTNSGSNNGNGTTVGNSTSSSGTTDSSASFGSGGSSQLPGNSTTTGYPALPFTGSNPLAP